jgi:leucyl aminopeptidase (aminopeptidase T)
MMQKTTPLQNAADIAMSQCMKLKKGETVLIIFDQGTIEIAEALAVASRKITNKVKELKIAPLKANGQPPSPDVAEEMKCCDVLMLATSKSLSHTKARIDANKAGVRIASLPGITKDMMIRCMNVDYYKIAETSDKIFSYYKPDSKVKITSKKGTDLEFRLMKRIRFNKPGLFHKKGEFGNLPDGEADIGIKEGSANGTLVIDASMASVGKLSSPIIIEVKDGFATEIKGKKDAKKLKEVLNSLKDRKAFNLAELGIGTHPKARITGRILEDEKVSGTAHIALGNNTTYGGKCNVPLHLDGVVKSPTITIDGKVIMNEGKLLI